MAETTNLISQLYGTEQEDLNKNLSILELLNIKYNIPAEKECSKCGIIKPISKFNLSAGSKNKFTINSGKPNYRSDCIECQKLLSVQRKKLSKHHSKPDKDYCCPICNLNESQLKSSGRWNDRHPWTLDHNHVTGEFRGWICNLCNMGIGRFKDDYNIVYRAYEYLKKFANE